MLTDAEGYKVDPNVGRCQVPQLPNPLKNRYFALRHGQSVANMEGIISSNPAIGTVGHGLTVDGSAQARAAATSLIELVGRAHVDSLVFISSDFMRARQTAEECRAALQRIVSFEREAGGDRGGKVGGGGYELPPVEIRTGLRERFFGELDGTVLINYQKVWPEDLIDGHQEGMGVESVNTVASRIRDLFLGLEEEFQGSSIVLTSHADTLQIMQCYVANVDERLFSQVRF
ncbi:unnamed protein product, partial [Discosporangium mesarthrocarpum]